MSTDRMSVQEVLGDQSVDAALTMTAQMFGLSKETVSTIVQIGLPMMAQLAVTNPELLKRMHAAAVAAMPEPIEDFYARMVKSPAVRQSAMDDYKAIYGAMFEAVNREAGRRAGTTDGQARDVMAACLPALNHFLAQGNADGSKQTFARQLGALNRQAER